MSVLARYALTEIIPKGLTFVENIVFVASDFPSSCVFCTVRVALWCAHVPRRLSLQPDYLIDRSFTEH